MKDKIKQAGFKNQTNIAEHFGISKNAVSRWCREDEKAPYWVNEYLDLRIENIKLREALMAFKEYL